MDAETTAVDNAVQTGDNSVEAAAAAKQTPETGAKDESVKDSAETSGQQTSKSNSKPQDELADNLSEDDKPVTDWSKVDLKLPKDAPIDEAILAAFGEQAKALGLTPKQARSLAAWQLDLAENARNELMQAGIAELRKDWGKAAEANQTAVMSLISRIDRKLGNDAFSKGLDASGATCNAAVCKGLLAIANMLSEDSFGGSDGARQQKPETATEGIENAFNEMKSRSR